MNLKWVGASVFILAVGIVGAGALSAQQGPPREQRGGGGGRPTEAMLKACVSKKSADPCNVSRKDGSSETGYCSAPQGLPLACVTGRGGTGGQPPGGEGGPPPGESNSGTKIGSTQAYTTGILCDYRINAPNRLSSFTRKAQWNCDRGQRVLAANGIPNHPVGQFPNPANPNSILEQTVHFAVTTSPIAYSGTGGRVKEAVMALNGIKFDPGTGGSCKDDITDPAQCGLGPGSGGRWNIEALGQNNFDFGVDGNHAHVQPGGIYHYHGIPEGMLSTEAKAGRQMALIGWAVDGFPVYARFGYPTAGVMIGALKPMRSSYRLKSTPDAGRPPAALVPMGAFMQDWTYVAGYGDLDECNGRFGSTPEFPEGIYHYYATDSYPYIQRCVKGSIESEPQAQKRRPQRGEGTGRKGPGGGGRGQRPGGDRPQ